MAVMTAARLTSGVAPFLVVFDLSDAAELPVPPNNGSGKADPAVFHYELDFGDPIPGAGGLWSTNNKSKNWHTGYVTAHVYELVGTYTATCTVTDDNGAVTVWTETITVTDFSGTELFCDSAGRDSNDGLTLETAWLTATKAESTTGLFSTNGPRRLNYTGGSTYLLETSSTITGMTGPFIVRSRPGTGTATVRPGTLLLNGTFATDTSWTKGVRWEIAGGVARPTGAGGSGADLDLVQSSISGMLIGQSYTVSFTVAGMTVGTIQQLSGTTAGTVRTASGNFSQSLTCAGSASITFRMSADWNGTIDSIVIVQTIDGMTLDATTTKVILMDHIRSPAILSGSRTSFRPGTDCLLLRMTMDNCDSLVSTSVAHGAKNGNAVVSCTLGPNVSSYPIFYQSGKHVAFLGNDIDLDPLVSNEHSTRAYLTHSVVAHNHYINGNDTKTVFTFQGYFRASGITNGEFTVDATGWTGNIGTDWIWESPGRMRHVAGNLTPLSQVISNGVVGEGRSIQFNIAAVTDGNVTPTIGTQAGTARSTVATHTQTIIAADDVTLKFVPSTLFNGTVDFTPTSSRLFMDTPWSGYEPTTESEYLVISDNIMDGLTTGFGAPFGGAITTSGDFMMSSNWVIERNKIVMPLIAASPGQCIDCDGHTYTCYRNNWFDLTNRLDGKAANVRNSATGMRLNAGCSFYNNVIYAGGAYTGVGIQYGASSSGGIAESNWLVKTSGAGTLLSNSGTNTISSASNKTSTTGMVSPPTDVRPAVGSDAIDVAVVSDYVHDDYNGFDRHATLPDSGAFEFGSSVPDHDGATATISRSPAALMYATTRHRRGSR